jgi:hypothetical protein
MSSLKTVKFSDINASLITATELKKNKYSKLQMVSFVHYDSNLPLIIQLPKIHLETYGIPRISQYITEDSKRMVIKVPLNTLTDFKILELSKILIDIDKHISSPEIARHVLGENYKKYTYSPIYRHNEDVDRLDYFKLKLDVDYQDGSIKTQLFKDGEQVQDINNINDFSRVLCYNCKFTGVVKIDKIWAQPSSLNNPIWGVTLKLLKAKVEAPDINYHEGTIEFIDSDEE